MQVIYSNEPAFVGSNKSSLFLVGPTPRSKDVPSWRPDALLILRQLNFDGIVLVPEIATGERFAGYDNQVEWEYSGLNHCDAIVAWVPRNMENMPALTTNVEFGYWLAKDPARVFYGRPDDAPSTRYLDWLYVKERNTFLSSPKNDIPNTLHLLLRYAVGYLGML